MVSEVQPPSQQPVQQPINQAPEVSKANKLSNKWYLGIGLILVVIIVIAYVALSGSSGTVHAPSTTSTNPITSAGTSNKTTTIQTSSDNKSFSHLNENLMNTFIGGINTYDAYNLTNASQYNTTGYNLSYEDSVYPFNNSVTGGWYVTANSSTSASVTQAGEILFYTNESQYAESVMYNKLLNQTSVLTYTGKLNISNGTIGNMHYNIIIYYPTPSQYMSRPQIWFFASRGNSTVEVVVDQEVASVNESALNEAGRAIINAVSTS